MLKSSFSKKQQHGHTSGKSKTCDLRELGFYFTFDNIYFSNQVNSKKKCNIFLHLFF